MRCIDGLCGDPACWYCSRPLTPDADADDLDEVDDDRQADGESLDDKEVNRG